MRRRRFVACLVAAGLLFSSGCGEDRSFDPDPAVAPFVGDWEAAELVITNLFNPDITVDLIALGATFALNVQPSGEYRAILLFAGIASTELGSITVAGETVTLNRRFPNSATDASIYRFEGNRLILDGETDFDFNLDGESEQALAHFELVRKSS